MTDHGDCNCEQALELKTRVRELEGKLAENNRKLAAAKRDCVKELEAYQKRIAELEAERDQVGEELRATDERNSKRIAELEAELEAERKRVAELELELERKPAMTKASRDVHAERKRQRSVEGWSEEHDDEHDDGSLAYAASWYAANASGGPVPEWPFDDMWKKPKSPRRDLVRAGALILAEIERLDRRHPGTKPPKRTLRFDKALARVKELEAERDRLGEELRATDERNSKRIVELEAERDRLREAVVSASGHDPAARPIVFLELLRVARVFLNEPGPWNEPEPPKRTIEDVERDRALCAEKDDQANRIAELEAQLEAERKRVAELLDACRAAGGAPEALVNALEERDAVDAERLKFLKAYQDTLGLLRSARQRLTTEREQHRTRLKQRQQQAMAYLEQQSARLLEVEQLPRLSVLDVVRQLGETPPPWKRPSAKWLVDADAVLGILCRRPCPEPPAPRGAALREALRIDQLPQEPPDAERGAGTYQGQGTHDPSLQGQGGSYPDW